MKRLLAYLFIVLGLGLTFNDNANAGRVFCVKIYFEDPKGINYREQVFVSDDRTHLLKAECYRTTWGPKYELYEINKKENKSLYLFFENIFGKENIVFSSPLQKNLKLNTFKKLLPSVHRNHFSKTFDKVDELKKKQLAQKEQSQIEETEKKRIAEEKRKIIKEREKQEDDERLAQAKKKKEEDVRVAQAKKKKEEQEKAKLYVIGSGTGFFVSSEGHIVSNDHVVGICRSVAAKIDGEIINFNVINTDKVNDLGLIKGDYKAKKFLSIKTDGAEFGEDIVAFGYPLSDALSTSVKLTRGIVSSLSGPGNNYSEIQIDAAIQPGNSGGPVLNMEGQVVGVASSGLNKLYMLESSEYIPENVNFAVAAPTLSNFLKANGVSIRNTSMKISNTKELAKIGRPATLQLFCMNTKAAYQKLKNKKKHSDVLLEKVVELR